MASSDRLQEKNVRDHVNGNESLSSLSAKDIEAITQHSCSHNYLKKDG